MGLGRLARRSREKLRRLGWKFNRRMNSTTTVRSRQGLFTIATDTDDPISQSLYMTGQFELDVIQGALAFLRELGKCPPRGHGTVIDIGANIGVISIGMLHHGECARAIAIEPEPRNFDLLEKNVRQNQFESAMICLPYAASDREGTVEFELCRENYGDHRVRMELATRNELYEESRRSVIEVPVRSLNDLMQCAPPGWNEDVSLIWMDVQGHEGYVLKGASDLLRRGVPVVAEFWPYGIDRSGMSQAEFCAVLSEYFCFFYVRRRERYIQYPLSVLPSLFAELPGPHDFENVIFL